MTAWLPGVIPFDFYGRDLERYIPAIYAVFHRDFVSTVPACGGKRFRASARPPRDDGREDSFWHLISDGKEPADRHIHIDRCERVGWPRPMLDRTPSTDVLVWRVRRGPKTRIVVTLADFSYVVVLGDERQFIHMVTAYPVQYGHTRRKLEREFREASAAPAKGRRCYSFHAW